METSNTNLNYKIIELDTIDSTNTYLKQAKTNELSEGTIVTAKYQTGGRGTKGRSWFGTYDKNIYMSILTKPKVKLEHLSKLSLYAGVALFLTLKDFDVNTKIKLPNDIYLNNKKLAGILTETSINNGVVEYAIVGIGINIDEENFPNELQDKSTSLLLNNFKIDKTTLINTFLKNFDTLYQQFLQYNTDTITKIHAQNNYQPN